MSENHDDRNVGYWVYQIWKWLTGAGANAAGVLTVKGIGQTTSSQRVDVTLTWDRIGAHVELTAATATTISAPANGRRLLMQALSQNVRYTLDGSAPTTSRGFQMRAGDPPILIPVGANTMVRVIQETATAEIEYQWVD